MLLPLCLRHDVMSRFVIDSWSELCLELLQHHSNFLPMSLLYSKQPEHQQISTTHVLICVLVHYLRNNDNNPKINRII